MIIGNSLCTIILIYILEEMSHADFYVIIIHSHISSCCISLPFLMPYTFVLEDLVGLLMLLGDEVFSLILMLIFEGENHEIRGGQVPTQPHC